MARSDTLRVYIKLPAEDEANFVEMHLKENEGLSRENQNETYKELNSPEIAIWDKQIHTGKSWTSGGTLLATDEARADIVKLKEIYNTVDQICTLRWALDGAEVGKVVQEGDAILGNFNVSSGTGTAPMATFSLAGHGALVDKTIA